MHVMNAYQAVRAIIMHRSARVCNVPTGSYCFVAGVKSATSCGWQCFRSGLGKAQEEHVLCSDPHLGVVRSIEETNGYITPSGGNMNTRIPMVFVKFLKRL